MYRSVVFFVCVIASQIGSLNGQEAKIVGGTQVRITSYPYQVSVMSLGVHICGGALIRPSTVISAAHCVDGATATTLSIRAGSDFRTSGGTVVTVRAYRKHPRYVASTLDYDMALIYLSRNLTFSTSIRSIPLYTQQLYGGKNVVATGWGTLTEGGSLADTLQAVTFPIISRTKCREIWGSGLLESMFCAGVLTGGKDTCQGDSGGPLNMDGFLVGITSHGFGCARPGFPGLYTKVPLTQSWINSNA